MSEKMPFKKLPSGSFFRTEGHDGLLLKLDELVLHKGILANASFREWNLLEGDSAFVLVDEGQEVTREEPPELIQHHSPCKSCPFARHVRRGATGGSHPVVFIGQARGRFLLHCHMDPSYNSLDVSPDNLQCPGAAIFRANCGWDQVPDDGVLKETPNREKVFANPAELLAHHTGESLKECHYQLAATPPEVLLQHELIKLACSPKAKIFIKPKK